MTVAEKLTRAKADYDEVYEAGKKAEYDEFWDSFQKNGERTGYENAFSDWIGKCFKPKYDLKMVGAYSATQLFRRAANFDLKAMTVDRGVLFDTSEATRANSTFIQSSIGEIPPLDLKSCTEMSQTFQSMYYGGAYTTTKITLNNIREDCVFDRTFYQASYLEEIIVTGTIGQNGFNTSDCKKLSKDSIISIVNALSDTATGKTLTLSKVAVETAFTDAEWDALEATKTNWTISLV
jgi:hypothetical protein